MKVVQVNSPFIISIDEVGQLATQLKLYIWNKGDAEPTEPNYILSKAVPSLINRKCDYNISNYLQEFIEPISAVRTDIIEEENVKCWCFFKVETFTGASIKDLTLISTENYVGLNGWTDYMVGQQIANDTKLSLATYNHCKNLFIPSNYGYFNLLLDTTVTQFLIHYENINGEYNETYVDNGIIFLKIPYSNVNLSNPELPCLIAIYNQTEDYIDSTLQSIPIEECKYQPIECAFQNARGGWQFLTFFKASTNSISVKGSEFNLLPNETNYNPLRGQSKVFNLNGNQTIKCNTGWVDENYSILMQDLLLSETVLIDDKPAKVKTNSLTFKTSLKDKMINYEIDFEYSYDLKNNVV